MEHKIFSLEKLKGVIAKEKTKGKKVVLCHGVFDLLHIGHIKHFNEAKNFGDILVVAPEISQSGMSHAISLDKKIYIKQIKLNTIELLKNGLLIMLNNI